MKKKYWSVFLMGTLLTASVGMFTSCKDYDDDIQDLQEQLNQKASIDDLNAKVTAMQTSVEAAKQEAATAKSEAEKALEEAEKALKKAEEAGNATTPTTPEVTQAELDALKEKIDKLKKELQTQIDKLASLEVVEQKIAAMKNELKEEMKDDFVTSEKLTALKNEVEKLNKEVLKVVGHRLTSISLIPTQHINGIAAIHFTTLQYTPQKYVKQTAHKLPTDHIKLPVLDHIDAGTARYISTEKNEAYFHVSPSLGVRTQDIELPLFDCITSENMTRAASISQNSPIMPVGHKIEKGVLTVTFKKSPDALNKLIGTTGDAHTTGKETFFMASLKAPLAESNWTEMEREDFQNGTIDGVFVNSEYARIEESVKLPYLANSRTKFGQTATGAFADEIQTDAEGSFYVHYHDSICAYESESNKMIDVYHPYDQELDLKKLVTVCVSDADKDHSKHQHLPNYADYGLAFRFRLANAPYITLGGPEDNTNKTDQQKFAKIDSPVNGLMTSKVYTIDGGSATAVGREPLVCMQLIDTKNGNALVAQRYLKVKWTMMGKTLNAPFAPILYSCGVQNIVDTEKMNVWIYDKAKEGGMTKNEFHSIYTTFDPAPGEGTGTVVEKPNTEEGVDSYNLVWTLNETDLGSIWPGQEKTFTKTVYYTDPKGINAKIKIVMTRTIYMPLINIWGYMGPYWKGDKEYKIFNINPIVFNTKESNPAWATNTTNNPTCNIYTDLLNGFLDDRGVKPTTGAAGSLWYSDKNAASKKFYYSALYPQTGGTALGVKGITYADDGVRFIFDSKRIGNYSYTWIDGNKVKAEVKANGTELWIKGQKAATIINNTGNLLNPSEITYNIRLEEAKPTHAPRSGDQPTQAAKALVGELVPINLIADICDNNKNITEVKKYEAFVIEPLEMKEGKTQNFIDAKIGGSPIDVTDAFTYYSWNDNKQIVENTTGLPKQLYEFYEVEAAAWPTTVVGGETILDAKKIKTNLKLNGGNMEPDENEKNGTLPANVQIKYEKKTIDGKLREVLTYYNYSGTPVNKAYKLYIPVEYGYKWKTRIKTFVVTVEPNSGTPGK